MARMARLGFGVLGLTVLLGAGAVSAGAQAPAVGDARWLPWIGCWEGATEVGAEGAGRVLVCFRPLAAADGVEIVSHSGNEVVGREELRADGVPAPAEEGGCVGVRSARWSSEGSHVFLSSDLSCGGTLDRATRGVLAVLPEGRGWIEVQAARAAGGSPVLGIRSFVPASRAALTAAGVSDPSEGLGLAVTTARARAGGSLTPDALVEVVERAGPEVANALIVERGQRFPLNASLLRSLSARGVPGETLDVMVAVTYPERFQIGGGPGDAVAEMRQPAPAVRAAERAVAPWPDRGRASRGYSPWSFGYFDPFWADPYFYFNYSPYGYNYSPYGYGAGPYGYRPFGGPYYEVPRVIVVLPPTVEDRGATLDRNRGLVSPPNSSTGTSGSSSSPAPSSARGSQGASPSSSGSGAGSASGGTGSGGSSDEVRRAVPRSGN